MPSNVRVVIYDRIITAEFHPGGRVYQKGSGLGRRAQDAAKALAPRRTGYMASTITHGIAPRGRLRTNVNLRVGASYGPFVEHGTSRIFPIHGKALRIPPGDGHKGFLAKSVSGQRAQHFLQDGMNVALHSEGYPGSVAD